MIPALAAFVRSGAAYGTAGRSFSKDAARSLVKGPQAGANADAAAERALAGEKDKARQKTEQFRKSVKDFRGSLTQTAVQVYFLKSAFEGLSSRIVGMGTVVPQVLKSIADPIASLTALANPAQVRLFEMAFNDTMAVVGRAGSGAMRLFTQAMEKVGDTYAKFEPIIEYVLDTLGNEVLSTFSDLADAALEMAPTIWALTQSMTGAMKIAGSLARAFIWIGKQAMVFNGLARAFGFQNDMVRPGATAKGAAVRQVNIEGSAADYARKAQEQAFMLALAGGRKEKKPEEHLAELPTISSGIEKIATHAANIYNLIVKVTNMRVDDAIGAAGAAAGRALGGGDKGAFVGREMAKDLVREVEDLVRMFRSLATR